MMKNQRQRTPQTVSTIGFALFRAPATPAQSPGGGSEGGRAPLRGEHGFALLAVMLVLALFGVIVAEFAFSMRLEATMARHFKNEIQAAHLAEAGIQQAIGEILADSLVHALDQDGQLVFYKTATQALPAVTRKEVSLGPGQFSYRISDEEAKINLNTASPDLLDRLLIAVGIEKQNRDAILDSIQDWKDPNELYRLNGAESDDYYLKLPLPYRAKNSNFDSVSELLQVKGVTREIFEGTDEHPPLAEFLTVVGGGQVNINTATPTVLKALGLSEAEITEIEQARVKAPYAVLPPRFAGRQLAVQSRTFRVESIGLLHGQPRSRVVALIQRKTETTGATAPLILSWDQKNPLGPLP
jgi:general secretion pathway protein K